MENIGKDLDWDQFLTRYGVSKGPLYNALGKVLGALKGQLSAMSEKKAKLQEQVGLCLPSRIVLILS